MPLARAVGDHSIKEHHLTSKADTSLEGEKAVVLTFDDGPSRYVGSFLDVLNEERVPAMFFWQSRLLHHKRPWKRTIAEGHTIGTHTHRHPNLAQLKADQQKKEIETSKREMERILGQPIRHFRPPFGQYNEDTVHIAAAMQLDVVLWDVPSYDWELKKDPDKIISNVVDNVENGSIILLHELEQTLYVLPQLIKELKRVGFSFRTL
ncbi:polysaccharide deacetylase family protein [Alkalihalophilus marmarensis]|uniref:polysaccharide deacetylase family protein n=1 Tax=Alkalihalophilus marmarensis TaxID=521377 RepID=UPI002E2058DF|nr:polysaccharide deacetylase family protein [Alkalihalophilus marmarensis]